MLAPNLISDTLPPLQLEDTGEYALFVMHENNANQLPVLDGKKYVGLISMEEVIQFKYLSKPLSEFQQNFRKPAVQNNAHIFDVIKAAVDFNVRVVPVVDEENDYLGLVSAEGCLRAFALLNSVKEPGAILELGIGLTDYSLSEVSRIVEDNEANILCLYTNLDAANASMQITIKLNTTDVAGIVSSFERFEYEVKAIYNDTEFTRELKDRYDSLMRYLNV